MWRTSSREVGALSSSTFSRTYIRPFTCASSNPARLVPHPPDLLKWVRKEGGFVHESIKIAQVPSYGLALVASHEIPKGSDLIALPPHLPLKFDDSIDGSASSPILTELARQIPEELWAMRLGLKLLQERAKTGSFWWPYISNLPETYSVPIFFNKEDIQNLEFVPLITQVNKRCRFLFDFGKQVKGAIANVKPGDHPFGGQDVDASALGWAMAAVSSRAFRLHGDKLSDGIHKSVPMMLPLIDMCNHSFSPNAKIIQDKGAENTKMLVKVVAEKHVQKDAPLELNYGCMNNDIFLLDYGFVIAANPYDSIELRYEPYLLEASSAAIGLYSPNFSSPASWQSEILSALELDDKMAPSKVTLGGPDLVDGRLLASLRVLHASDVEKVREHDLSTLQLLSAEAPLGIQNELAALRTIIGLCVLSLKNFPTQMAEDEALLKQGVSTFSELAIQFRLEKKSMIVNVMREMSKRVKLLLAKESTAAA
ncbi:histone-lysine N-methyltransferase setd3-like [Chenopodium quinoa]|uniref:histone-lysine N-methyltransferase setd3-like n=1 Tax=Chenopodium quinoa TaxID=63459 RepID=UPI000B77E92F|nr:histone-lysine N-methyltransferase setd3-like [Chenopodium quinoa]